MGIKEDIAASRLFDLSKTAWADYLRDLEWPWDVLKSLHDITAELASADVLGDLAPGAYIIGDVAIGPGTVVEPGAVVKGPTYIGADCEIRTGAYIRGDSIIGDRCVVGNSSEIKNSLMLEGSHAPHYNYVGDSVIGLDVNLGAGVKLSNWKISADKDIVFKQGEEVVDTGLDKIGAILGDGVEIGCNSVLNPGTVVGPRTIIYANANVRGFVPGGSVLKLKQTQEVVKRRDL
ncbi:MAG: glucose-1-phosphate thymidylyltransferase [Candidatus Coatesbacteria bacterium]|nr:MAG: glucose-1-phosphate thymidylyltransferase [Candidatus Coatesbacteria bacterium]